MLAAFFFFLSFANPKSKGSISLVELHADMEKKAEYLYPTSPRLMSVPCHEVLFPFPAHVVEGDSALRFLTLGIPSVRCMADVARNLTYL